MQTQTMNLDILTRSMNNILCNQITVRYLTAEQSISFNGKMVNMSEIHTYLSAQIHDLLGINHMKLIVIL